MCPCLSPFPRKLQRNSTFAPPLHSLSRGEGEETMFGISLQCNLALVLVLGVSVSSSVTATDQFHFTLRPCRDLLERGES